MSTACELWPLAAECLPPGWSTEPGAWTGVQRAAVEIATGVLRRFSGGQYGLCRVKVRPCRKSCASWSGLAPTLVGAWMTPVLSDGQLYNIPCGCRGSHCGCGDLHEIPLDPAVHDILEVRVDGQVLPNTAYRVDSHRMLVRTDGQVWPRCQQLGLPDTAEGTWSVTYRRGTPPDRGGELAVTLLAIELVKACSGDKNCALPARVTSVVREGVTYDLIDEASVFERGRTGIPRVDMWLAAVNPYGARTGMRAYSPDTVRARSTTWPVGPVAAPPSPAEYSYIYVQNSPQAVWTIVHNLGYYPAGVTVEDSNGIQTLGEVSYPDIGTVRIDFSSPVSGVARLS